MTTKVIMQAIGKLCDPKTIESEYRIPEEEDDYIFRIAFLMQDVDMFEEYVRNPLMPYFKYEGPIVKVIFANGYERMVLADFDKFNKLYDESMKLFNTTKFN